MFSVANRSKLEIDIEILERCRVSTRLTRLSSMLNTNAFFTKSRLNQLENKGLITAHPLKAKKGLKLVDIADQSKIYLTTKQGLELLALWNPFVVKYNLSVKLLPQPYIERPLTTS